MFSKAVVVTFLIGCFLGPVAFAVEYFPSEPGPVFVYGNGYNVLIEGSQSNFLRVSCPDCYMRWWDTFTVSPEGDVLHKAVGNYSPSHIHPGGYSFDPPLMYLDFPLEAGKYWFSTAEVSGFIAEPDTVTLYASVIGEKTVTVPAGDFEVIEVLLYYRYEVDSTRDKHETLWLHKQLGPVGDLVSWTGVVGSEATSWGGVKSLYR